MVEWIQENVAKIIPIFLILYIFSPIDFIPDIIPLIGTLDDGVAGIIAIYSALKIWGEK